MSQAFFFFFALRYSSAFSGLLGTKTWWIEREQLVMHFCFFFFLFPGSASLTLVSVLLCFSPVHKLKKYTRISSILFFLLLLRLRFVNSLLEEPEVAVIGAGRGPAGSIIHKLFVNAQRVNTHTHTNTNTFSNPGLAWAMAAFRLYKELKLKNDHPLIGSL